MSIENPPRPSVSLGSKDDGWLVTTYNLDGKAKQERFFYARVDADVFMQEQYRRIREAE